LMEEQGIRALKLNISDFRGVAQPG
jgi:hypothetical protein